MGACERERKRASECKLKWWMLSYYDVWCMLSYVHKEQVRDFICWSTAFIDFEKSPQKYSPFSTLLSASALWKNVWMEREVKGDKIYGDQSSFNASTYTFSWKSFQHSESIWKWKARRKMSLNESHDRDLTPSPSLLTTRIIKAIRENENLFLLH